MLFYFIAFLFSISPPCLHLHPISEAMADESLSLAYSGGSDDNENEVGAGAVQPWDSVDKETDERSHLPHYGEQGDPGGGPAVQRASHSRVRKRRQVSRSRSRTEGELDHDRRRSRSWDTRDPVIRSKSVEREKEGSTSSTATIVIDEKEVGEDQKIIDNALNLNKSSIEPGKLRVAVEQADWKENALFLFSFFEKIEEGSRKGDIEYVRCLKCNPSKRLKPCLNGKQKNGIVTMVKSNKTGLESHLRSQIHKDDLYKKYSVLKQYVNQRHRVEKSEFDNNRRKAEESQLRLSVNSQGKLAFLQKNFEKNRVRFIAETHSSF